MRDLTEYYKSVLELTANLSRCNRLKVAALIVNKDNIISFGYNGTPKGVCNDCEDEKGETHKWVLHAESNAITKAARYGFSIKGTTLYSSVSPCWECAKLIIQSGISELKYIHRFRDVEPLIFLENNGIKIYQI